MKLKLKFGEKIGDILTLESALGLQDAEFLASNLKAEKLISKYTFDYGFRDMKRKPDAYLLDQELKHAKELLKDIHRSRA